MDQPTALYLDAVLRVYLDKFRATSSITKDEEEAYTHLIRELYKRLGNVDNTVHNFHAAMVRHARTRFPGMSEGDVAATMERVKLAAVRAARDTRFRKRHSPPLPPPAVTAAASALGAPPTHGFRAFIFTDIKSSSALWEADAVGMRAALGEHGQRVRGFVQRGGGMVVKTIGDAFMVVFGEAGTGSGGLKPPSVIKAAVATAISVQRDLAERPIAVGDQRLLIRLGIAYGDVDIEVSTIQHCTDFKDYFGSVVNTASRMESVVSPVGGFALALNPRYKLTKEIGVLIKGAAAGVEIKSFGSACPENDGSEEVRRSMRLLDTANVRCVDPALLKGVGERTVVVVAL